MDRRLTRSKEYLKKQSVICNNDLLLQVLLFTAYRMDINYSILEYSFYNKYASFILNKILCDE